jgi:nucleotide-binding universal stress UspA family protein
MKTILVPTDFSNLSHNAIDYAVELSKPFNSRVVLFHAYHVPVVNSEMSVNLPSEVELEKDIKESLRKIEKNILDKNGKGISVETICKQGFAVDVISEYTRDNKVDLIVMGTQGGGFVTEKVLGSVTSSLIKRSKCPVLVVGKDMKFEGIKNVLLAYDYHEIKDSVLNPLKELVVSFKAHVFLLHVNQKLELVPSPKEAIEGIKLDHLLEGISHSFNYAESEDVAAGFNRFAKEKNADITVLISREHSVLWNLFHEANTKKMAFHSVIPFMALHE